jgi:hypothetical protein
LVRDDRSAETAAVKAENKVTYSYLDQVPFQGKKPHGETLEL